MLQLCYSRPQRDNMTFNGHTQTYVIGTAVADVSAGTMAIQPPLVAAVADDEPVTVTATHVVNLAFHRDSFSLAMRPLQSQEMPGGGRTESIVDPVSGIALRLEVTRQHKQNRWSFDALWGAALTRPQFAVRILG